MNMREVKIAYIRSLEATTQCELAFELNVIHSQYGSLNQDIKSVRQLRDNVTSLLSHTKNKIVKLLQDENQQVQTEELDNNMNISLSRNDQEFPGDMSCMELLRYKSKIKFKIFGITYKVVVNAPLIQTLTIPNFIYANTCVKPQRLKGIHLDKSLSKYKWSKSKDKVHWTDIFYEVSYNTTLEDLNHYLKLTCTPFSRDRTPGPVVEVVSENTVDVLPDIPSTYVTLEYRKPYTEHKLTGKNLRVVSYNVLAERYTDDNQFIYCDPKFLSIDYRKHLILKELINYKADIICLQEVDLDHYHSYFKVHFKNNDYISTFYKKGHMIPEGLSLIFDRNRFKKLDCKHIVLSQEIKRNSIFKDIWNLIKKRKDVKDLFIKQHTSLLVGVLKLIETNDILIIANTHLYYHREAGHIRMLQVAMALRYIKQMYQNIKAKEDGNISVIFCGDFNSRPDTAVYQFLTQKDIEICDEHLQSIDVGRSKVFQHDFNFVSACGTPEFTNFTDDFKGCLDYIFHEDKVKVTQILPFPSEEEVSMNIALPNQYFPSDHISLVVDLML